MNDYEISYFKRNGRHRLIIWGAKPDADDVVVTTDGTELVVWRSDFDGAERTLDHPMRINLDEFRENAK